MVKLPRLSESQGLVATLAVKLETTNPGGSVKDRPAVAMIDAAERDGLLKPGGTIVEPTSGNTGVGLAIVAAQRGYRCIFVMTDKVAPEKVALLRAYGAEVVVCPVAVAARGPASRTTRRPSASSARSPARSGPTSTPTPRTRRRTCDTTGPEIWRQTAGRSHPLRRRARHGRHDHRRRLATSRRRTRACRSSAPIPKARCTRAASGRPYLVEGVGEDFWPDDLRPVGRRPRDRGERRGSRSSWRASVAREEGTAHRRIGRHRGGRRARASRASAAADDLVVVLIPDSGRGYLSRIFNDEWMADFGFLRDVRPLRRGDVLDAAERRRCRRSSTSTRTTPVREAVALMRKHGVSQLPVIKNEPPFAAAEVPGAVDELELMDAAFHDPAVLDRPGRRRDGPEAADGRHRPVPRRSSCAMLDQAPAAARALRRPPARGAHPHRRARRSSRPAERPWVRSSASRSTDGLGFETRADPRRPGPRPGHAARSCTPITLSTTFAQDGGRRAPGLRVLALAATRPAPRSRPASRRSKAARTASRSRAGLPAEDASCARSCARDQRILLGNDAYGGTFRLDLQGARARRLHVDARSTSPTSLRSTRPGPTTRWSCGSRRRRTRCSPASTSRRSPPSRTGTRRAVRRRQHVRHAVPAATARARRRRRRALGDEVPRRALRRGRRLRRPRRRRARRAARASSRTRPARCPRRSTATSCCAA